MSEFDRPVLIISAPRSGSTLLFETLALFPDIWTVGDESHEIIEGIPSLHPATYGYASNRLTAAAATPDTAALLQARFISELCNRDHQHYRDLPTRNQGVSQLDFCCTSVSSWLTP